MLSLEASTQRHCKILKIDELLPPTNLWHILYRSDLEMASYTGLGLIALEMTTIHNLVHYLQVEVSWFRLQDLGVLELLVDTG